MTIWLIRHGESVANAGDKNIIDPPLTALGREQASNLKLRGDLIICSPMRRTLETYHYSSIIGDEFIIVPDFRERICGLGDMMLLQKYEIETIEDYNNRICYIANYLIKMSKLYDTIIVICHGCIIKSLTDIRTSNTQIVEADINRLYQIADKRLTPINNCCVKY